ncbi:hypothetical protein QFC19_002121 [Naganishia cerealis]|uniref:Uncharacterized protein n=1 Tax=Naganishia cerealis TaxID=610337 RepID=A0ACC2WEV0_9TREE|nr:hypothetical protein QFC19_002121 [Naganishia cerealis]
MEFPPRDVSDVVHRIATLLRARNHTLAVSEAACGGLLSAYLVSVPGASDFYIGGKLLYSLKQRLRLSGWLDQEIQSYVGPSELVALKLARTTRYELGLTYVLSETGYAGPSTDLHLGAPAGADAVGTVFLGVSGPNGEISTVCRTGKNDRSSNMIEFARHGLEFLLEQLEGEERKEEENRGKE